MTVIHAPKRDAESTADGDQTQSFSGLHLLPSDSSSLAGTTTGFTLTGDIEPEHLKMISGFGDVGDFVLPRGSTSTINQDDLQRVHDHLALQLRNFDAQQQDTTPTKLADSAPKNIGAGYATSVYQNVDARNDDSLAVHVYRFHVFSNDVKDSSETAGESTSLLFRWAKPSSVYGNLQGSWQSSLIDVIGDGARRAGSELMILLRRASGREMRDLQGIR